MALANPPGVTGNPVGGGNQNETWIQALLGAIGAPDNMTTELALALWAQAEGDLQNNNPLNISGKNAGATTCYAQCGTSSPIYAYATLQDGVNATAAFLQGNNYGAVIAAFQKAIPGNTNIPGNPGYDVSSLNDIWVAINQSGWCRGCSGGQYPDTFQSYINNPNTQGAVNEIDKWGTGAVSAVVGGAAKVVQAAADPLVGLETFFSDITKVSFWKRVGLGLLGALMIVVGIVLILGENKTIREAATVAAIA